MKNSTGRADYPSDISDPRWETIANLIPLKKRRGRRSSTNLREIVNGINYRWSTGCVWRMLPHDFPPWPTVYTYFRIWQRNGMLKRLRDVLLRKEPRPRATASPRCFQQADDKQKNIEKSKPTETQQQRPLGPTQPSPRFHPKVSRRLQAGTQHGFS